MKILFVTLSLLSAWAYIMAALSNPGHINMKQAQHLDIDYLNE
jgi:hypothetical protein